MLKKLPTKLPKEFKTYFWDTNFNTLNPQKYPQFVLARLLDTGNTPAVRWSLEHYSKQNIKDLLTTTQNISRKSANYWAKTLNISNQQVLCLQKPYHQQPFKV